MLILICIVRTVIEMSHFNCKMSFLLTTVFILLLRIGVMETLSTFMETPSTVIQVATALVLL